MQSKDLLLSNAKDISNTTKNIIDDYFQNPENKDEAKQKLELIFGKEARSVWSRVLTLSEFNHTFRQILGKRRLHYLKDLLMEIDNSHYTNVNFD